jgi:hypothetical protein
MNLELLFSSAPFLAADASDGGGGKSAAANAATAGGDGGGIDAPFLFLHPNHSVRVRVGEPARICDEAAESKQSAEAEDEKEFKVYARRWAVRFPFTATGIRICAPASTTRRCRRTS